MAHIFRTHFWFVEERLRTLAEPRLRRWLAKACSARARSFSHALTESPVDDPLSRGRLDGRGRVEHRGPLERADITITNKDDIGTVTGMVQNSGIPVSLHPA